MKKIIFFTCFAMAIHCSYASPSLEKNPPIPSIEELLEDITRTMGLQNNFELKAADVLNIEACISHKKRMILYNPVFIDWINKATGSKWATLALLAHELGHHLNGHTIRRSGSEPSIELEADEFAGYVLRKMGASLKEAQEVMYLIANNEGSRTHPARFDRMLAIQHGWTRAMIPVSNGRETIAGRQP
jgi:hypothetical protein